MKDNWSVSRICHIGRSKGSCEQGQGLTEFALVMPLLIALLVAIMVFAWVGFSYVTITNAAREGAHWATTQCQPTEQEIKDVVDGSLPYLNLLQRKTSIFPDPASWERGTPIAVTVQYTVSLPAIRIPYVVRSGEFVLGGPMRIQAQSRMRLNYACGGDD